MCNSVMLSNKMGHLMVAEVDGEIQGWFSLRELTEAESSITDARMPQQWQKDMTALLLEIIQEIRESHKFKSVLTDPRQRPDEILAQLMASHMFDELPELKHGPVLLLDTVVVEPSHVGEGLGTKLLKEACAFAMRYEVWIVGLVPEYVQHRFIRVGFQSLGGTKIKWAENWTQAEGHTTYFTMAFVPKG